VRIKPGELYDTALLYLCGGVIWGSIACIAIGLLIKRLAN
jgi:hypothetical protein